MRPMLLKSHEPCHRGDSLGTGDGYAGSESHGKFSKKAVNLGRFREVGLAVEAGASCSRSGLGRLIVCFDDLGMRAGNGKHREKKAAGMSNG